MKRGFLAILSLCLAVVFTAGCCDNCVRVGKTLPAWSEGELDIHAISTGRGECIFMILPDGTSIVADVGEFSREGKQYTNVIQRPNAETRPVQTYGDYIRHFNPTDAIDYLNVSHFHMDHMGNVEPQYERSVEGDYIMTGVTALHHHVPYVEVIDRAYGAYDSLAVKAMSVKMLNEYKKFIEYHTANGTIKASRFELGAVNQFALKHNAAAYPNFRIENVCSNGYVWDNGVMVDVYEGKRDQIRENAASCGFVIRYGAFDFFTAGDIGDYHDLELRAAEVVGEVEAVKAHHHLSPHSMCLPSVEILKPQTIVATSFYNRDIQPDKSKFDYIAENGCNLYCTSVGEQMLAADPESYKKCAEVSGHIVIRVAPGGDEYMVYSLDDTDSKYRVKNIFGPFKCK